ncbi:histidine kinase [uncultured Kordia sp.]|uniref:sensor histidine kinase n=1 Tax=uncultured Kordia sp. TaxID=507699 RepID=UPI00260EAC67|nr:histidine kinase [uncultured Kordia sp.]
MKRLLTYIRTREWLAQGLFLIVLFFLYSFDKHSPIIELHKFFFFLHYMSLAFFIGYVLLPLFFYTKKFAQFFSALLFVFAYAYVTEELVLEKIFFDDDRARYVSNVFYTLLEIVPLVMTMVSFKFAWDVSKKQSEVEELKLAMQESELRFLKSQINPHFLFNNLNNLYSYALENSPKTPSIILELSSVLRYMLYDCKEDYVSLTKEIEHLKHFTGLNELQIENRGIATFKVKNISENYVIAPLILIVFLENAFKHSAASQTNNIVIDISLNVSLDGKLSFSCSNSFLPVANTQSLSKGIGLENVKKRLEILYPDKHQLAIKEFENTYNVYLTLQLQERK